MNGSVKKISVPALAGSIVIGSAWVLELWAGIKMPDYVQVALTAGLSAILSLAIPDQYEE